MTQDEIIEMARQANLIIKSASPTRTTVNILEAFAKLVAEKATDEANARANASWTLMCKKMVAAEREACAEICDNMKPSEATFDKRFFVACTLNAQAIRARGQE